MRLAASRGLHVPEFWKRCPVVIVTRHATLRGVVTIVPMTSRKQRDLQASILIRSPIDGSDAWAICNHVTAVAVGRLLPTRGRPLVSQHE